MFPPFLFTAFYSECKDSNNQFILAAFNMTEVFYQKFKLLHEIIINVVFWSFFVYEKAPE